MAEAAGAKGSKTASGSWFSRQRLVTKLAITLLFSGGLMSIASWGSLHSQILPTFASIEFRVNAEQEARARHSLADINREIGTDTLDYAVWDDAYNYVATRNPLFEAETLSTSAYQNMGVDLLAIVRLDGTPLWCKIVDLASGKVLAEESREFSRLLTGGALLEQIRRNKSFGTYVRTTRGIYVLHTAWVTKSDGAGPVRGFLVKGRLLSAENLSRALQVKVNVDLRPDAATARALLDSPKHAQVEVSEDWIRNRIGLIDAMGKLLGVVEFDTKREFTAAGNQAVSSASAAIFINFLLLTGIVGVGINRVGVQRLAALREHMRDFHQTRSRVADEMMQGADEIADLAREFDGLIGNLNEAEAQLRERSYLQGKADSASGLLHNVRNAVAPLLVSLEKWVHEEKLPWRTNLRKALDAVDDPACDAARRIDLDRYIHAAARKSLVQSDTRATELEEAKDAVDQIILILSSQDRDNAGKQVEEVVDLGALLTREARQLSVRLAGLIDINLHGSPPPVLANQVQLGQIVSNLFVNAVEAMEAAAVPRMRIDITVARNAAAGTVSVSVKDNGEGADPTVIASAFERGFSTRTHKSGGIGLHWCANAMRAMGGSLRLSSEGQGTGATAIITLRCADAAANRQTDFRTAVNG